MYKLVFDEKVLQKPCQPEESIEEGRKIAKELLKALSRFGGVGLAANQVGINKRICVVNVIKPVYFINPEIVGKFGKVLFSEGCLSYEGKSILTERYSNILVKADNFNEPQIFNSSKSVLECVCVQHEIDHLNGVTMFDRQYMLKK